MRRLLLPALVAGIQLIAGCGEVAPPVVSCDDRGVDVSGDGPISRVEVWRDGVRLARRVLPQDSREARLDVSLGEVEVEVRSWAPELVALRCTPTTRGPLDIRVAVPAGQELRPFPVDGSLSWVAFEGADADYAVVITARRPGRAILELDGERLTVDLPVAGQREVLTRPLSLRPTTLRVLEPSARSVILQPVNVSAATVEDILRVVSVDFPTDPSGASDLGRPSGRVTLPGKGWTKVLAATGLGVRGRDRELPWASHAVTLANAGEQPLDVVLESRVLDDEGPAPAFLPVVRDVDGGTGIVSGLLRVPAGAEATAVLPLFVDEERLAEGASAFRHEVRVTPIGLSEPVLVETAPLVVSRGNSWVALGFGLALLAAVFGVGSALVGVPRWLRAWSTSELTTIAVFATLGFVVTAATAVVSSGLAAVLGPFSMLLTGLLSDCLRSALLATLVVLLPRRGTATVFLLLGWLMQGVALGAFSPTDFVFVGARIFWLELFLWLAGLTRGGAWRDGSALSRFTRLAAGFAGASLLSMAGSLASQIVLFRLYYAAWFVLLMLALPGFLYDVLACVLATSFAASLREVQG